MRVRVATRANFRLLFLLSPGVLACFRGLAAGVVFVAVLFPERIKNLPFSLCIDSTVILEVFMEERAMRNQLVPL